MSLILSIETGTDVCSVALSRNDELLALRESAQGQDHARKLALYIDQLLKTNGYQPAELDAIAVSMGPGSYTGLRIGVSTAKGICYALDRPLIAVGSLDSLAAAAVQDYRAGILELPDWEETLLCPMIDARRMEVYCRLYDSSLQPVTAVSAEIIDNGSFAEYSSSGRPMAIFGNGAAKCREAFAGRATYIDVTPSARGMVDAAYEAFLKGDFVDTAYFEPLYLKDFVVTQSKKRFF